MATARFKAHCSVRGWISDRFAGGGGISAVCSSSSGGGISADRSGVPSSMTRELEMISILIVGPFIQGREGNSVTGETKEDVSMINQSVVKGRRPYLIL
jgi:hypothetical protein